MSRATGDRDRPVNAADGADGAPVERTEGATLITATLVVTVVLVVVAVLSAVFHFRDDRSPPDETVFAAANVVVSLVLFLVGCVMFVVGFLRAIGRSRTDQIDFSGLFFLAGSTAPARVKRPMLVAYGVQLVVAVGTAAARPITDQAFVIMAPMWAQGAMALWGGTYGTFAARDLPPGRPAASAVTRPVATSDAPRDAGTGERGAGGRGRPSRARRAARGTRARTGARGGPRPRPKR